MPPPSQRAALAVALAAAVAFSRAAAALDAIPQQEFAYDRIVGLLTLPEVFGDNPCEKFVPGEILLYAAPDARRATGSIRVDRHWTLPECSGLMVNVHAGESRPVTELPTREHAYEAPAAIVLERRGQWYRVQLAEGSAWLRASARNEYLSLEKLLADRMTYLTDEWDGRLHSSPGAIADALRPRVPAGRPVRVQAFQRVGNQLWIRVSVMTHSICQSADAPTVAAEGWLPAYSAKGQPTVWFHSRGC